MQQVTRQPPTRRIHLASHQWLHHAHRQRLVRPAPSVGRVPDSCLVECTHTATPNVYAAALSQRYHVEHAFVKQVARRPRLAAVLSHVNKRPVAFCTVIIIARGHGDTMLRIKTFNIRHPADTSAWVLLGRRDVGTVLNVLPPSSVFVMYAFQYAPGSLSACTSPPAM